MTLTGLYRTALQHLGVRGVPKGTGRRGVQIWIPLVRGPSFDETRAWVEAEYGVRYRPAGFSTSLRRLAVRPNVPRRVTACSATERYKKLGPAF